MSKLLTIGIPTYNRVDTISACLKNLSKSQISKKVDILIIDNASNDGTFDYIKNTFKNEEFEILKNKKNLGFSGNTIELIKRCKTEYLIWNPDEDEIITENIKNLIIFLNSNKPSLVSTQYFIENKIYRGTRRSRQIKPAEIWSAVGHLPGIIFHIPSCKEFINEFNSYEIEYPTIYKYYPQILLATNLFLKGKCLYWENPISKQIVFIKESHALDESGVSYNGLNIRWKIHKELINYFESIKVDSTNRKTVKKLISCQKLKLYETIRQAIGYERSDFVIDFDLGSFIRLIKR